MKKIPSFTIDHIRLLRGIYVSRQDEVNGETVTTFDIRMKEMCIRDSLYAIEKNIDFIAHSFVRNKQDILDIKAILDAHNSDIRIVAKIENQGGVSAEVIATDFEGMVREGEVLAALHPRIVVKLPCTCLLYTSLWHRYSV